MRRGCLVAIGLVNAGLWTLGAGGAIPAFAAETSPAITRVTIAVSGGPVALTDELTQEPPAIVITFRSRNVIALLPPVVAMESGIVRAIQSDYYPPGRRALKSLTLTLVQPAAYTIAQQANQIVIDIETPSGLLPGRMTVGQGLTVLGIEAKETVIGRLKAMEGALQEAAPRLAPVSVKPQPLVLTKPVHIPQPVAPVEPTTVPGRGRGGLWYGLGLGIGGTMAVAGWRRRRRKAARVQPEPSAAPTELPSIARDASEFERLVLKAMQRQGYTILASKLIANLGSLWIMEKDQRKRWLLCHTDGEFLDRHLIETFHAAIQREGLSVGTVVAAGSFTLPAQTFAREQEILLIGRDELLRMIGVELKSPSRTAEVEALKAQLATSQGERAQAHERIKTLEQERSAHAEFTQKVKLELDAWGKDGETWKKKSQESALHLDEERARRLALEQQLAEVKKQWEASEWYLGEERAKRQALEQQVSELTKQLTVKDELCTTLVQEADQLKAKSAEADQHLAAERERLTQLEGQFAEVSGQLKAVEQDREQLQAQRDEANTTLSETRAAQESLQEQLTVHQEGREQLQRKFATLKEQLKALQASPGAGTLAAQRRGEQQQVKPEDVRMPEAPWRGRGRWRAVQRSQERRTWHRLPFSRGKGLPIRAIREEGEPVRGEACNISAGGLCMDLPASEALPEEFQVRLFFPYRSRPVEATAKTVWRSQAPEPSFKRIGARLSFLAPTAQEYVQRYSESKR